MLRPKCRSALILGTIVLASAASRPAVASDPPKLGWADTAELSYVATSGNTKTDTLGFKDKLTRTWERSLFTVNAGGIRVQATTTDRFAVGTSTTQPFQLFESKHTDLTAENYYLNGRFDHNISEHFFWFGGVGWDKNTFAGIQNRYTTIGGVGNIWVDTDHLKFRTDYAVTYTKQSDVVLNPLTNDKFAGARLSWSYLHKLGATTTYTNDFVADENLNDTKDFRGNMINSLSVSMTKRLAIKASLQWLYDHEPSFKDVDLFNRIVNPTPPPGTILVATGKSVPVQLDRLDTVFTTSLVVNF